MLDALRNVQSTAPNLIKDDDIALLKTISKKENTHKQNKVNITSIVTIWKRKAHKSNDDEGTTFHDN